MQRIKNDLVSLQRPHTFALVHLPIDLGEDARVAENHNKQGENIQRHKVKHVVCRLLPAMRETSMGDTLSEVRSISFDGPKDEQLRMERVYNECTMNFMQSQKNTVCLYETNFRFVHIKQTAQRQTQCRRFFDFMLCTKVILMSILITPYQKHNIRTITCC